MWNSAWLEDVKWSFATDEAKFRDWNFDAQKTNYADWSSTTNDGAEELYDAVASAVNDNYPPGYLLFRHFVDELEDDSRMEFYVNHLSEAECAEVSNSSSSSQTPETRRERAADDEQDDGDNEKYYYRPRLDTVPEETDEDLARDRGEDFASFISANSDDSGETTSSTGSSDQCWKWGNGWLNTSDDDSGTVIDVPLGELNAPVDPSPSTANGFAYGFHEPAPFDVDFELSDDAAADDDDDDAESPVKRRRTEDSDEASDLSRAPSLTDSLAQFELLEKEINEAVDTSNNDDDLIFRTSATSAPFEDLNKTTITNRDCDVISISSQVFFDCREDLSPIQLLETSSDGCSDVFVDPFEEPLHNKTEDDEDECWNQEDDYLHSDIEDYDSSGTEEDDEEDEAMDSIQTLNFFTRSHRMRSFRSYGDGLNAISDDTVTLNSNSSSERSSISPQNSLEEPTAAIMAGPRSSAEALSEDSGYGDAAAAAPNNKNNSELELLDDDEPAMCTPDATRSPQCWLPLSAILVRRQPRTRSPLSVDEAEEFNREEIVNNSLPLSNGTSDRDDERSGPPSLEEICIDLGHSSPTTALMVKVSDAAAAGASASVGDDGPPHLDASNFKRDEEEAEEGAQDRRRTDGSCYTAAQAAAIEAIDRELGQQRDQLPLEVDHEQFGAARSSSPWPLNETSSIMDSAFYPQPVVLKRYGPHHEVEVYISSQKTEDEHLVQQENRLLSVPSSSPGVRGVHFSPVVSSVNWRESYLDQSDSDVDVDNDKKLDPETLHESSSDSESPVTPVPESPPAPSSETSEQLVSSVPPPLVKSATIEREQVQIENIEKVETEKTVEKSEKFEKFKEATTDGAERKQAGGNKKPALFQRFSLSRLSARMSATFGRSSDAATTAAAKKSADKTLDGQSQAAVIEASTNNSANKKSAKTKNNNKKMAPSTEAPVEPKKIDEFKKEPSKKRGFFKQFYRSASSPPAVKTPTTSATDHRIPKGEEPPPIIQQAPPDVQRASNNSTALNEDGPVSRQTASESSSPKRLAVKPPLPPSRTSAKKTYLDVAPDAQHRAPMPEPPPPPTPVVSSAGLQVALEHFKESARMERERLVNSVPDLVNDAERDCGGSTVAAPSAEYRPVVVIDRSRAGDARAPDPSKLPPRPSTSTLSRERARQAAISRANVVHDAWNATASRAALNLSRRNLASTAAASGTDIAGSSAGGGRESGRGRPVAGLLETDLDVPNHNGARFDETNLDELIQNLQKFCTLPSSLSSSVAASAGASGGSGAGGSGGNDKRFKSMLNLGCSNSAPASVEPNINETMLGDSCSSPLGARLLMPDPNRAKSMEFLLDEDNKSAVQVPENQLKKCGERQMSEHELRVQRSLQKLNVPDWYKKNARPSLSCAPSPTSTTATTDSAAGAAGILRRREYGSSSLRSGTGWTGLRHPMATSMTSLGSELLASRSATPIRAAVPPTRARAEWRTVKSSRDSLTTEPNSLPNQNPVFSRWTSGRASYAACPSPAPSTTSTASYRSSLLHQHGRTPYLGWRSQERLNSATPAPLSVYQSPSERLANSLLSVKHAKPDANNKDDDSGVRSSIRQVTSAIVHYVNDGAASSSASSTPRPSRNADAMDGSPERHPLEALSRSPSPRRQRVWVESSFVGDAGDATEAPLTRPVAASRASNGRPVLGLELMDDQQLDDGIGDDFNKREASLDDVLNSLLGLPTRSPTRSPSLGPAPPGSRRVTRTHEPVSNFAATGSC